MTYTEARAFLDRLSDFEREGLWRYDTKHFSLDRMRALLTALGDPQHRYASVIVAGTKGKGSTSAMLSSMLTASGRTVGLYTSPHLIEWRERIRLGGEPVDLAVFGSLAGKVAPAVDALTARGPDHRPTAFEAVTAMALLGFAEAGCELAVLEIGLGGRLDAVNAVDAKVVCITSIGFDHMEQLGDTIEAIAAEKAGVIKSPAPVVTTAGTHPAALPVIAAACGRAGASLTVTEPLTGVELALAGGHQRDNAAIAVEAARLLVPELSDEAMRRGLSSVRWPGRFELLATGPDLIVDGAHTAESAEALLRAVRELRPAGRIRLVFAMLKGKPHAAVVRVLVPVAERIWCPSLKHPRALPAAELAALVREAGGAVAATATVTEALAVARAGFDRPGDLILVAGSLALVGEAMVS